MADSMGDENESSPKPPNSSSKEKVIDRKLSSLSAINGVVLKAVERRVFGMNVTAARVARGWTLSQLGEEIQASTSYVRLVEVGLVNISIDRMASFSKIFGFPLYEMLNPRFRSVENLGEGLYRPDPSGPLRERNRSRSRKPKV